MFQCRFHLLCVVNPNESDFVCCLLPAARQGDEDFSSGSDPSHNTDRG